MHSHLSEALLRRIRQGVLDSRMKNSSTEGRAVKRWLLTALVALLVPLLVRGQAPDEKKLDEIVSKALKTFEAPGLAIVIVKGDQVVYRKGAGVRELGSPEAITEDTVFQIASCTKAFLAMLLAILIGDGLIDWDDPVHKHVPNFRLSDPLADQNITIRDLLCHRTGLRGYPKRGQTRMARFTVTLFPKPIRSSRVKMPRYITTTPTTLSFFLS